MARSLPDPRDSPAGMPAAPAASTTSPAGIRTDEVILSRIEQLSDLFRRRLLDDRAKAKTIASLTAQLDGLHLAPLCREFILLIDRIDDSDDDVVRSIRDEILGILSHYGLEPLSASGPFAPATQRAVGVEQVSDTTVPDRSVIRTIRTGYTLNGLLLRPTDVVIAER
ncbi:nucleotide exchange factor GrpE [Bifidobacterium rousetti]|nr:nucleotide exchange factor GrpE [Bifidobacterium rousetti]